MLSSHPMAVHIQFLPAIDLLELCAFSFAISLENQTLQKRSFLCANSLEGGSIAIVCGSTYWSSHLHLHLCAKEVKKRD